MSVQKPSYIEEEYNEPIRGSQGLLMWFLRILIQMGLFFLILYISSFFLNVQADYFFFFIFTCVNYMASGFFAFFGAYAVVLGLFALLNLFVRIKYKANPIPNILEGPRKRKKICIYIFVLIFQSLAFIISSHAILIGFFPFSDMWSYIIAWLFIAVGAKICGYGLYFILSHMKMQF